jgi:predicted permease
VTIVPNILTVAIPFITILFLLALGAVARRWRTSRGRPLVTADGARQMTGLVLNVSLPALIFVTLATEIRPADVGQAPLLAVMGVVGPFIGYLLSAAASRFSLFRPGQRATFQTAVAVTNTAFIGYPLCEALLGSRGLLYAVLYDVGLTGVMSTLSIWLLIRARQRESGKDGPAQGSLAAVLGSGWGELLRTPMMWALVAGAIWGALGWPTPEWLIRPLRTLGQLTTPLALLTVGMLVQPGNGRAAVPGAMRSSRLAWQLAVLSALRLLVAPALIWTLTLLLKVDPFSTTVIVLQTAVPSAVATTAMVEQYGGDSALASAAVITTTLLSMITLPLWSGLLLGLGGLL